MAYQKLSKVLVLCALLLFAITPALCLYLDPGHIATDYDCPFCNVLLAFVAIFVAIVLTILPASSSVQYATGANPRSPRKRGKSGPIAIRGPPRLLAHA